MEGFMRPFFASESGIFVDCIDASSLQGDRNVTRRGESRPRHSGHEPLRQPCLKNRQLLQAMNFKIRLLFVILSALILPIAFTSCGAVKTVGNATKAVGQTAAKAGKKVTQFSLADVMPAKVEVVEVRENDLKEMPLGKDRALAYQGTREVQQRRSSFFSFTMPADFKEPTLPDIGDDNIDLLLPPKPL